MFYNAVSVALTVGTNPSQIGQGRAPYPGPDDSDLNLQFSDFTLSVKLTACVRVGNSPEDSEGPDERHRDSDAAAARALVPRPASPAASAVGQPGHWQPEAHWQLWPGTQ